MKLPTVTLKDHKKTTEVTLHQLAVYQAFRVLEAYDHNQKPYFLIFHKDRYLNYVTASRRPDHSFVQKAFQSGTTFSSLHPITKMILTSTSYKKQSFNDLFQKLQHKYPLDETALIATYFYPFIKKEKLSHFIQKLFYQERRDGKWLSCFRILQILRKFDPSHPLLSSSSQDLQFSRYEERYKKGDPELLSKDPIYSENQLHTATDSSPDYDALLELYQKQNRLFDMYVLQIAYTTSTQNEEIYCKLIETPMFNNSENKLEFLKDFDERGFQHPRFQQDYLNQLIKHESVPEILSFIPAHSISLSPEQADLLLFILERTTSLLHTEKWQPFLEEVYSSTPSKAEEFLHLAVCQLLSSHDPDFVVKWMKGFKNLPPTSPTRKKLEQMQRLAEDPNHQRELGLLYYEYKQPEKAIECMSWEVELYVDDPKPVQWLAKLYQETGRKEEHDAYQKLYVEMMKRA
ncbi:hypothetical protein EQV77_16160 [Halobacillus fulvus]|nr:hypothetical protein EQV77_16160 [Halobacillus fulvus]